MLQTSAFQCPPSPDSDASSHTGVSIHINKASDTSSLSNLIEIIWSGFSHFNQISAEWSVEKKLAVEPEIKKGKSPGAEKKEPSIVDVVESE